MVPRSGGGAAMYGYGASAPRSGGGVGASAGYAAASGVMRPTVPSAGRATAAYAGLSAELGVIGSGAMGEGDVEDEAQKE